LAFKTLNEIRSKIQRDLDLEVEEFIQPLEMIEYINDAITLAEAKIIDLGLRDKYFFARTKLSIVQGAEDIELPSNIYANKIVKLVYSNGTEIYPMKPMDREKMFEEIELINSAGSAPLIFYRYLIRNDTPGGEVIQIVPKARQTLTDVIVCWYYRDANRLSADTDLCDLPEISIQFVYQYVRVRVYEKEKGASWLQAKQDLMKIEVDMLTTLQQQIADSDLTKVEQDFSAYEEHS